MAMQSGFIKRIRDIMRMDAGINGDAQRIEQMVWMLFLKVYDAKEDDWELNEDNYESIIPEDLRWRNWAKADSNGHAMTGDKLLNFVKNTLFPVLLGNDVKEGDTIVYEGIKVTPDTPIKKAIVKSTFEAANNYMKDGVYLRQVIDVIDEIEFDDVKESHAFGFVYEEILRELQSAGSSGEFYTQRAVNEIEDDKIENPTENIIASGLDADAEPETNMDPATIPEAGNDDETGSTVELTAGMNVVPDTEEDNKASNAPKAMPYIVRVNTGERVMINKAVFKIGKANRGVDFTISGNGAVSRVHAIIYQREDGCYLKDNKTTNSTYVNGQKLAENQEVLLKNDSEIVLGDEDFIFKLS